jgi:hypothetical protein
MDLSGSWTHIQEAAKNRLSHNKTAFHIFDYGEGIEVLGAAGEVAARRFFGLPEELHTGFDSGCDLVFAGKRIDVKATVLTPKLNFRYLQWPQSKRVKSDIILLTAVDPISMQAVIVGYATRLEVELAVINNGRAYPCKEIAVINLHPPYELIMEDLRMRSRL